MRVHYNTSYAAGMRQEQGQDKQTTGTTTILYQI
jgi:hypothetical protein